MRVLLMTIVSAIALTTCGPVKGPCSPTSCSGCCDATGECRPGTDALACGAPGSICSACGAGATCNSTGSCVPSISGTGGSGAGGAGGGGGSTGSLTTWSGYCSAASEAIYDFYVRCGQISAGGAAQVKAEAVANCLNFIPPGVKHGRARVNSTGVQMCLDGVGAATCAIGIPSGCNGALIGLVPLNGNCFDTQECDGASWCDTSTTCPGRCVPRVAVGQPATIDTYCVNGAYAYNGVCTALVAFGQSCAPTGGSTQTRGCVNGGSCVNGVCGPRVLDLAAGAACQPNMGPECQIGTRCVAGTCAALGDVGAACDSQRLCKYDLQCGPANVCVRAATVGAACSAMQGCVSEAYCNRGAASAGTCAAKKLAGQSCVDAAECGSGLFCGAGVCAVIGGVGAPCTYDSRFGACQSALYCTATSTAMSGVCANQKGADATCTSSPECLSEICSAGKCGKPRCEDRQP